jgi:hypothetical protein
MTLAPAAATWRAIGSQCLIKAARSNGRHPLFCLVMIGNGEAFISEYHRVGNELLTIPAASGTLCGSAIHFSFRICAWFGYTWLMFNRQGSTDVGLATLNLNVVAVCAVFAFVGAILLGAF